MAVSDCAVPRFSSALLGALALHGLVLLLRVRHAPQAQVHEPERAAEQSIDIDDSALTEATGAASASDDSAAAANDAPNGAPLAARLARSAPRTAASSQIEAAADAPEGQAAAGLAAQSAEPGAAEPERKIDLGFDGHFFMGPPSVLLPRIQNSDARQRPDAQRRLDAMLSAPSPDDLQRGLARGSELVGSLNSAVRTEGPVRGEAMFRVTVGPDGGLLSAELVHGAEADWGTALKSFRALAAKKHLRVPPGAHGLRVTFSVKAKVQRPSGKEVEASEVGVAEPSLKPNGLTLHGDFDLADLGGGGQRLVYARVVSEEVL